MVLKKPFNVLRYLWYYLGNSEGLAIESSRYAYVFVNVYNIHVCVSTVDCIFDVVILFFMCFFRVNIIKLCKPLSKLDLPTLRQGSVERTQLNKLKSDTR